MVIQVFGKLLCHLLPYAQGVSVYISALTLTSIAIDRFFVIIYPFKPRMEIKVCLAIITGVWVTAFILTFPYGWYMDTIQGADGNLYCEEEWPREESRTAFGFSTSILQFVIPFSIIAFCYTKVCKKLRDRAKHKPGEKSARKEEMERERTRRTNRMLISMVVIFGISWLPLNINNLVQDFYEPAAHWPFARSFFLLAHAAAMSSTCYNPFLYAWLNENFRKEFKQVLPCYRSSLRQNSLNLNDPRSRANHRKSRGAADEDDLNNGHEMIQLQEQPTTIVNMYNNHNDNLTPETTNERFIPSIHKSSQNKSQTRIDDIPEEDKIEMIIDNDDDENHEQKNQRSPTATAATANTASSHGKTKSSSTSAAAVVEHHHPHHQTKRTAEHYSMSGGKSVTANKTNQDYHSSSCSREQKTSSNTDSSVRNQSSSGGAAGSSTSKHPPPSKHSTFSTSSPSDRGLSKESRDDDSFGDDYPVGGYSSSPVFVPTSILTAAAAQSSSSSAKTPKAGERGSSTQGSSGTKNSTSAIPKKNNK